MRQTELHLIVHNIRSAENVGSILRTSECLGVRKVWITGYSPRPVHAKVKKTALGAENLVDIEERVDVIEVLDELRASGIRLVALERTPAAVEITDYSRPAACALLLGNEVEGIPPSLQSACDDVVAIRQVGEKESFNVSVAAAIAAFWFLQAP